MKTNNYKVINSACITHTKMKISTVSLLQQKNVFTKKKKNTCQLLICGFVSRNSNFSAYCSAPFCRTSSAGTRRLLWPQSLMCGPLPHSSICEWRRRLLRGQDDIKRISSLSSGLFLDQPLEVIPVHLYKRESAREREGQQCNGLIMS